MYVDDHEEDERAGRSRERPGSRCASVASLRLLVEQLETLQVDKASTVKPTLVADAL
ncbi:MAG: hypothetical protein ACRDYA_01265 [Egibacteraceae bacterium]